MDIRVSSTLKDTDFQTVDDINIVTVDADYSDRSLPGAIMKLATGRGIVIAINFATGPILGRLFPPNAYGVFGVISTVIAILAASASLSYVSALPVAATSDERRNLFVLCSLIGGIATAVVSVGSFLGAEWLAYCFGEPDVVKYALYIPLLFAANALRQLLDTTLGCQRRFGMVSFRNVLEIAVTRIVQFGACLIGFLGSPAALIVGTLFGGFISALPAGILSIREVFRTAEDPLQWAEVRRTAVKHRKFPLIHYWSLTLSAVTFGLPTILIALRFSIDVVGLYNMAYVMVTMPLQLFSTSAMQVFYVESGNQVVSGKSAATTAQQIVRIMLVMTSFPLMVILTIGPLVFELFLGSRWHEAGVYAQILVPWMMLMAISAPLAVVYAVHNRQGEGFLLNIVLLTGKLASLYFGGLFFGPRITLALFSAVAVLLTLWQIFRPLYLFGVSWRWAVAVIIRTNVESLLLLLPAGILYWCFHARIATLIALTAASVVYAAFLYRRHPEMVQSLLSRIIGPELTKKLLVKITF